MSTLKSKVEKEFGEVIVTNSFCSPVSRSEGVDFSDDFVEVYELREFVKHGPSGEPEDFTIEKKPVLVDSYHLNKVVEERSKGCSFKEIIAKCERTGDYSPLVGSEGVYADVTKQPRSLSDALQEGVRTAAYIDSLSDDQKAEYIRISKMNQSEFDAYIESLAEARKKHDDEKKSHEEKSTEGETK